MSTTEQAVSITIEGPGFTFNDAYATTDPVAAREAARSVVHFAMRQLSGGGRRRKAPVETPAATSKR